MKKLSSAEIAARNRTIAKAEQLVNARGEMNKNVGACEIGDFEVVMTADSDCRIRYRGRIVFVIRWGEDAPNGHQVVYERGGWETEFLALQAAHS